MLALLLSNLPKRWGYTWLLLQAMLEQNWSSHLEPIKLSIIKPKHLIRSEQIKPVIDQVFPSVEAQKAMEYSESGRAKGKIILKIK